MSNILIQLISSLDPTNTIYNDIARQFMKDSHLYYSGIDNESMFKHISTDFIWHWESDKTVTKSKFIELNKELYGFNNRSDTQFLADVIGDKYIGGISYAWFERGNGSQTDNGKSCRSWMFTWEIFIFSDEENHEENSENNKHPKITQNESSENNTPQIIERYSFPVHKRLYHANNEMLSEKKCRYKETEEKELEEEGLMEHALHMKMIDFFGALEAYYLKRPEEPTEYTYVVGIGIDAEQILSDDEIRNQLYGQISDAIVWYNGGEQYHGKSEWMRLNERLFMEYDEIEILYEMDTFGEFHTGGYTHIHVKIGECNAIYMQMIIAYFDWDLTVITELVMLPVDQRPIKEFEKCVKQQEEQREKEEKQCENEEVNKKKEL